MWGTAYERLQGHPVLTGWLGSATTLTASAVAGLEQLDLVLRVAVSGLGVVAGALTVLITFRRYREKTGGTRG